MIYRSDEAEKKAALHTAELMAAAARTAPKGCGVDEIETLILDGAEKDALADEMRKIAGENGTPFFERDAGNIDSCHYVVLIGVRNLPRGLKDCGLCGLGDCGSAAKAGARCAFGITDLGIAVGSAASVTMDHRVDNRILFTAGKGAARLGLFSEKVKISYGIGLSISGKNVFFDRALP
ncbi:MAG: DUF2148 domain-containing protein [Clostridiales Family XIII bacterium]|nr:DUF2148 domain-containing protein [Clostridiales Family XIII bacterium]